MTVKACSNSLAICLFICRFRTRGQHKLNPPEVNERVCYRDCYILPPGYRIDGSPLREPARRHHVTSPKSYGSAAASLSNAQFRNAPKRVLVKTTGEFSRESSRFTESKLNFYRTFHLGSAALETNSMRAGWLRIDLFGTFGAKVERSRPFTRGEPREAY